MVFVDLSVTSSDPFPALVLVFRSTWANHNCRDGSPGSFGGRVLLPSDCKVSGRRRNELAEANASDAGYTLTLVSFYFSLVQEFSCRHLHFYDRDKHWTRFAVSPLDVVS